MAYKLRIPFSTLFVLVSVITVFYTNCANQYWQVSQDNVKLAEAAYQPLDHLQKSLIGQYGSSLTESICNDSQRYFCDHRNYSAQNHESQAAANYECITIEGTQICPQGLSIVLDSSELAKECLGQSCDQADIENSDYFCYLALPNVHGTFPIQGHFESLEQGLTEVRKKCLELSHQVASGN